MRALGVVSSFPSRVWDRAWERKCRRLELLLKLTLFRYSGAGAGKIGIVMGV